jgi:hypothetical protein
MNVGDRVKIIHNYSEAEDEIKDRQQYVGRVGTILKVRENWLTDWSGFKNSPNMYELDCFPYWFCDAELEKHYEKSYVITEVYNVEL